MLSRPIFWKYGSKSILINILKPISFIWLYFTRARIAKYHSATKVSPYVICVGNILMGGTGKTPVAIALAKHLKSSGKNVHFITRGYKRKSKTTFMVEPHHSYLDVGDEALLLSKHATTWVGADRVNSANLASKNGADVIIMDDGFQYPYLKKDKSILVVEGEYGFGNCHVFPAGPLRETIIEGYKRASSIIVVGKKSTHTKDILDILNIKTYCATIEVRQAELFAKKDIVAFSGIGNPEKFFKTLAEYGANIIKTFSFPDHHNFKNTEIEEIINLAKTHKAMVVTTEKDYVRLINSPYLEQIQVMEIDLIIDGIKEVI